MALLGPQSSRAQTAPSPETIVVTARKRAERILQTPLSVAVVNGAVAARNNLNNLQDILAEVPDADFRQNSTNNQRTLFVRGIGTISTSPGVEPSVSTVVDGVVLGRSGQAVLDLVDLAQVEVLGGPQGTLFGKNASAGVVNITTAMPRPDFHAWLEGDYFGGNGNEERFSGGATGTIAPHLTGNISVLGDNYDGNVRNLYNGKELNGYRRDGFRSKLLYEPSEDFSALLEFDYMRARDTIPVGVFVSSGQTAYPTNIYTPNPALANLLAAQGIVPGPNNTTLSNNVDGYETDDNGGMALTLKKMLGLDTLTSITAWRIWNNVHLGDYDSTSAPPIGEAQLADYGTVRYTQTTQEIRLESPKGGWVDYVLGGFFMGAHEDEIYDRAYAPAKTPATIAATGDSAYGTRGDDEALFGEADLHITPHLTLIAGARGVRDRLDYYFERVSSSLKPVTGIRPSFDAAGGYVHLDYTSRLGLQYAFSPDAMAYFTYSRGYKSPAYNVNLSMQATDTSELKPETNNSFEVGLKASLANHRLQTSLAGFIENFSNYQANFSNLVNGAIIQRLINAGAVSSRGVEGSLTAEPAHGLQLGVDALYDDAKIDSFDCPPGAAISCNVNGQPLPFAPRFKLSANASYRWQLTGRFALDLASIYSWQSKVQYQLTELPSTIQPAYGIWDANIGLADLAANWRVTAVVKNITNQHYSNFLAPGNLAGVIRYVPRDSGRYAGVELRKEF